MKILFTKTENEEHVLSCKRDDGSTSWLHVRDFFIAHDICHYAVETTIPLKDAFFGMVSKGTDITDFALPKEQRNILLSEEALFAEHLVNLLTIEYFQGRMDNFPEILNSTYNDTSLNSLITEKKLAELRMNYHELMERWRSLPINETMTLSF